MKLNLELKEGGMPTEAGLYVCEHPDSGAKQIVEVRLHPIDNVLVIFQFGRIKPYTQYSEDKGFFWSERIEI